MLYQTRNFSRLLGMEGFSDRLLTNHFTLYEGYVEHTNQLLQALADRAAAGKTDDAAQAELRRRLGWEWNGMRLHELYFEQLGGDGKLSPDQPFATRLGRHFDGPRGWEQEFRAVARTRGSGWVILYQDRLTRELVNCWIDEHHSGHLAGAVPLVIFDAFEHAYMLDYGIDRAQYIDAFFRNLDWEIVELRAEAHASIAS